MSQFSILPVNRFFRRKFEIQFLMFVAKCFCLLAGATLFNQIAYGQFILPQDHEYQVTLRDWMAGLNETDFEVSLAPFVWNQDDYADLDDLFNKHLAFYSAPILPNTDLIRGESKWFVLDDGNGHGIEGSGTYRVFRSDGSTPYDLAAVAVWWSELDWAGNPHRPGTTNHRSIKLRAAVTQAADMILTDNMHSLGIADRSDFLGGAMLNWGYVYYHTKDELPASVQEAFEAGFSRMLDKLDAWGPHDVNTNMDTRAIPALWYIGEAAGTTLMRDRVRRLAKKFLFGSETGTPETSDGREGIFHPAGYIGEQDGPETTYNGISLYFLSMAALASKGDPEWDAFMPEVIRRMVEFKSHNAFPDPDGFYDGPSSFSKRTTNSYVYDQRRKYWRDVAVALVADEGKYLFTHSRAPQGNKGFYSEAEMVDQLTKEVNVLNSNHDFATPLVITPPFFGKEGTNWWESWSRDWGFTYEHMTQGVYSELQSLIENNDPLEKPPFARDTTFDKRFDNEFWASKAQYDAQDFGWLVESVRNAGGGYSDGYLGGGSLAAFYTENAGKIILGRMRRKGSPVDTWNNVEMWAAHHMWGYGDSGEPFSTARNRATSSSYTSEGALTTVTVTGYIGDNDGDGNYINWARSGALNGPVEYQREFEKVDHGLRITSRMNTNDAIESVTELWEAIPIFLRDNSRQSDDAEIDFRVNGVWQQATSETVMTDAIRIQRFGEYAYIVFDELESIKLSSEVWTTNYQSNSRIRIIHIDMLGSSGGAVPLPAPASVSYTISTIIPAPQVALVVPGDSITYDAPASFDLLANATDSDGTVRRVDFFDTYGRLGVDRNGHDGWSHSLEDLSAGHYTFTARAVDDSGNASISEAVTVIVNSPASNLPPTISLIAPSEGDFFPAGSLVEIVAEASDTDGEVSKVEFFADQNKIGEDNSSIDGWSLSWESESAGSFALSARSVDNLNASSTSTPVNIQVHVSTGSEEHATSTIPSEFALYQNFPNPFKDRTTVMFDVPLSTHVKLSVFDASARHVSNLIDHFLQQGKHSIDWDARGLSSGVYILQLQTNKAVLAQPVTLLR